MVNLRGVDWAGRSGDIENKRSFLDILSLKYIEYIQVAITKCIVLHQFWSSEVKSDLLLKYVINIYVRPTIMEMGETA